MSATPMKWERGCGSFWTGPALRWAEGEHGTYAVTDTEDYGSGAVALWVFSHRLGRWSGASCAWFDTLAGAMSAARALERRGADCVAASVEHWQVAR